MTTLQREILFFVLIIASLATALAVLIVILWAAWYAHPCCIKLLHPNGFPLGCILSSHRTLMFLVSSLILSRSWVSESRGDLITG